MDTFSSNVFRDLAIATGGIRVSLFMPTHVGCPEEFQDGVRFKRLLDHAEKQLGQTGMSPQETGKFLSEARKLPEQESFWHNREKGLALFIDRNGFQAFRLPIKLQERVAVSDRFVTRYLLPLILDNHSFLLLALSRNQVKFYRGTQFSLEEIHVSKMPVNVDQVLSIDSADRGQQVHVSGRGGSRKQNAVFHGQGGEADADQRQFREFLHTIIHAIEPVLANSKDPLVVAGVGYEAAEFKSMCHYPHLTESIMAGNPNLLNAHDLHDQAWNLIAPMFAGREEESIGRYQQQFGTGMTSNQIAEIALAAHAGDLDTLIVDSQVQHWGHFDPVSERIILHDSYQPMDHDLVDTAMAETFKAKGTVRIITSGKTPSETGLAAIYRKGRVPRAPRLVGDESPRPELMNQ